MMDNAAPYVDTTPQPGGAISPDEAAEVLGCSARTVRRYIAEGQLSGTRRPYATTRAAVDELRRRQQAQQGEVVTPAAPVDTTVATDDTERDTALMVAVAAELSSARDQVERLARECGRLQAELAQERSRDTDPLPPEFACSTAVTQSPAAANGAGDRGSREGPDVSQPWPREPEPWRWGRLFGWLRRL